MWFGSRECDNNVIQSLISELSVYYDKNLLCQAANKCLAKSKVAIEGRSANAIDVTEYGSIFELFAAHAEMTKGMTVQYLSKVWSILHKDTAKMLDVPSQLNMKSIDALLLWQFSTNDRMLRY